MDLKNFVGSVSTDEFIQGLLLIRGVETLGDIWEKCADCCTCLFAKQCQKLGDYFEERNLNPRCGQIIDLLLGDIQVEDIK